MEKFHLYHRGLKAISIRVVHLFVLRGHSLLLLLFADCLANAGAIVVNILSMYPMRQTWCGSRVSHHCFYVDPSDSICCVLGNPEARRKMLDKNIDRSVYSQLPESICSKQSLILTSKHFANRLCRKRKRRKAELR